MPCISLLSIFGISASIAKLNMTRSLLPCFLAAALWPIVASAPLSEWMSGQVANFGGLLDDTLHFECQDHVYMRN